MQTSLSWLQIPGWAGPRLLDHAGKLISHNERELIRYDQLYFSMDDHVIKGVHPCRMDLYQHFSV